MTAGLLLIVTVLTLTTVRADLRQPRSDDVTPLQAVVSQLSEQVTQQQAQIAALQNSLQHLQSQQAESSRPVAFRARLSNDNHANVHAHEVIHFDFVQTNLGSAYDQTTGIFTAPVSGLYVFLFSSLSQDQVGGSVYLHVDGESNVYLDTGNTMATQHAVLHLDQGDKAWVAGLRQEAHLYSFASGFTGFLLQPDLQ